MASDHRSFLILRGAGKSLQQGLLGCVVSCFLPHPWWLKLYTVIALEPIELCNKWKYNQASLINSQMQPCSMEEKVMESIFSMKDFPSSIFKLSFYSPLTLDAKSESWPTPKEFSFHCLIFHLQICLGLDSEADLNSSSGLK